MLKRARAFKMKTGNHAAYEIGGYHLVYTSFNCPLVVIRQCNHKNNHLVFK